MWSRVKNILFSPEMEAAIWRKFNITRENNRHDFRIQIDHAGRARQIMPATPGHFLARCLPPPPRHPPHCGPSFLELHGITLHGNRCL